MPHNDHSLHQQITRYSHRIKFIPERQIVRILVLIKKKKNSIICVRNKRYPLRVFNCKDKMIRKKRIKSCVSANVNVHHHTMKCNNRVNFSTVIVFFLSLLEAWERFLLFACNEIDLMEKMDIKNTISDLHKRFIGFFSPRLFFYVDSQRTLIILYLLE